MFLSSASGNANAKDFQGSNYRVVFFLFSLSFSCAEPISVQSVSVNNIRRGVPQLQFHRSAFPKTRQAQASCPPHCYTHRHSPHPRPPRTSPAKQPGENEIHSVVAIIMAVPVVAVELGAAADHQTLAAT